MLRHRNEFPAEGDMPDFDGATAWLNAGPMSAAGLRGRVVLVSFGTYTCINWIRSLPYARAWADTYAAHGLAVVGAQTPEFEFEGDLANVERASSPTVSRPLPTGPAWGHRRRTSATTAPLAPLHPAGAGRARSLLGAVPAAAQ